MVKRMYLNTSILIRALSDEKVKRFLEQCCKVYRCVVSSVHDLEPWRSETLEHVKDLLRSIGAEKLRVSKRRARRRAFRYIVRKGLSSSRFIDVMHLVAAKVLGCRAIAAVDRFIWRHAKHFSLLYLNHYTGCRDP